MAEVAARTRLSTTTCWRRIQQLEQSGVIKGRVAESQQHVSRYRNALALSLAWLLAHQFFDGSEDKVRIQNWLRANPTPDDLTVGEIIDAAIAAKLAALTGEGGE